ncbi:MAG TPA: hypothetical protein VHZ33_37550 [Trebonia sp.]|jgi:hypothetical protein|nr:hypothetical protein [Trebonia sp.]
MTVNDRLRATTDAVTASMREVRPLVLPPDPALLPPDPAVFPPDQAPLPLDPHPSRPARRPPAPPGRGPRRRSGRRPGRRGWGSWLVPLAAAVAVIALAVTLVTVRDAAGPRPTSPGSAPTPGPTVAVPDYYVAVQLGPSDDADLDQADEVNTVVVGNASTGRLLAALKPPEGSTFDGVTGAADDRTFVLGVRTVPARTGSQHVSYSWDALTITPGAADPVRLTRLPIAESLRDAVIHGLALSPDGRTLAVMFTPDMADGGDGGPTTLRTYSVASGRPLRTWTGSESDGLVCLNCNNTVDLTWSANGRELAFRYPEAVLPQAVRTLDLSAPGDSLDAGSRVIFPITAASVSECIQGVLSPDWRTMLCGTTGAADAKYGCATYGAPFDAYSIATQKPDRVLYRYRGSCAYAESSFVWAGSATVAIGAVQAFATASPSSEELIFGLISRGGFTRLHVTMRNESLDAQASPVGLIAF